MDKRTTDQDQYELPWYRQVKFKALFAVATLFVVLMLATTELTKISATRLFEDRAHTQLSNAAQNLQSEIIKRTNKAEVLVKLIADLSAQMAQDPEGIHSLVPDLIQQHDPEQVIAGGGVWPEPNQFDPTKERNSFFWARDEQGTLQFLDDYNDPQSTGYHHEEWYVPARHLLPGRLYWSKSYTDPYSEQAMVTVTAAMESEGAFIGVATLDLKLEGLQQILYEATKTFGGYAFAVDKHGHFMSFPDVALVGAAAQKAEEGSVTRYQTLSQLASQHASFKNFEELLELNDHYFRFNQYSSEIANLAISLARGSYQIDTSEAIVIAQELLKSDLDAVSAYYFRTETDQILGQPTRNLYLNFEQKGWHIVSAMPESYVFAFVNQQINNLNLMIGAFMFSTLFLTAFFLDNQITKPLRGLVKQLRKNSIAQKVGSELVSVDDNSEFGLLADHFNQRTAALLGSQKEIQKLAFYDPLTSLPNRRLLNDYLNSQLSEQAVKRRVAVMFIDIDNFKTLNDSLGHAVGDQLLVQMAERLGEACDNRAFIARLGGDEFVIVTSHFDKESEKESDIEKVPTDIAIKIACVVDRPFNLNGNEYHVTVSMGIALDDGSGVDELLKHADAAMYSVKEEGRNGWCFFESAMQVRADERLQIESELRDAIKFDQLDLVYQPQVDRDGELIGLEALSRWHHSELGYISPPKFISVAEESMLIHKLGEWLLESACKQMVAWDEQGLEIDHIAINISPRQIQDSQFVAMVVNTIRATGVKPEKLMMEITEGVLIHFPESVIEKMQQLRELGIRWSVDDFGTGYSSLTYLKRLPLDELKIDKSFVNDLPHSSSDEAIVETIISIAQKFGFKTIAEGVESEEQRQALIKKGCKQFQGYLFSPPMPAVEVQSYVVRLSAQKSRLAS